MTESPKPLQEPTHKPLLSPSCVSCSEWGFPPSSTGRTRDERRGPGKAWETGSRRVDSEKGTDILNSSEEK